MKCELCGHENVAGATVCLGCGDTSSVPVRPPWWMKKRWRAAALTMMAYPFTLWFAIYLAGLGVVQTPSRVIAVVYAPVWPVIYSPGFEWFLDGNRYFYTLGRHHAGLE